MIIVVVLGRLNVLSFFFLFLLRCLIKQFFKLRLLLLIMIIVNICLRIKNVDILIDSGSMKQIY